ncbi:MAG: PKD domain-containing protein, partial [Flavobacteriaceae bacterium]|nr:PKD domain-containing protein [Flavobacteriaceae bacterium]
MYNNIFKTSIRFFIYVLLNITLVYSQDINMQNGTVSQCSGTLFDSGGALGNYSNNENLVLTICSPNADEAVVLDFTSFSTQNAADILTIYDGDDTSGTVIGNFSGSTSPGYIVPSNAAGCLTLEWNSNGAVGFPGWEATINCATPCQTITAIIDSTNPPQDGSGNVTVSLGASIDFFGDATFSDDGTGATYSWNFGDTNTDSGQDVSYTYSSIGTFTVTLTVTDTNPTGCSGSVSITVNVLGPYINVDPAGEPTSTYTIEQLVEDVLINSACAGVSNINSSTGLDFGNTNGIGHFVSNGIAFPFAEGIILTTGRADDAEGPETGTLSSGGWPGDLDLENAITGLNTGDTNDATFIEFDFIPLANSISFNFIFASEEYGTFQCTYTDAFAFLLTDTTTGVTTNLAVVPGTTDEISVLNVRDNLYNTSCPSVNPDYFDTYYGTPNGQPEINSPIDFRGHTVSMQASSPVIPNTTYNIKLVIADDGDTLYDAAVFLEAGSFNLGGDLGDDITIESQTAPCYLDSVTLDTQIPTATHTWYQDGNEISGETGSTLTVTEPGEYSTEIFLSENCQATDSILIEFIPNPEINIVENLSVCNTTSSTFDLTINDSNVLGTQSATDFNVSYYHTLTDAENGDNPIDSLQAESYIGTDGEIIYVRIEDNLSQICYDVSSFELSILNLPTINNVPDLEQCDDANNDGVEAFELDSQTLGILGSQDPADFVVTYYSNYADADAGTNQLPNSYTNTVNSEPIYVRVEGVADASCYNVSVNPLFNLILHPRAEAFQPSDLEACDYNNSGDESELFDLTIQTNIILGTQSPLLYELTYYELQSDAEQGINPITGLFSNTSNPQVIYARVTELAQPTCFGLTTFSLTVHSLPNLVSPTVLAVCDDGIPDGLTSIDLSIKNLEISGGNSNYSLTYYLTQLDADLGLNQLAIPYTNI